MFARRFFPGREFAPRYFPGAGLDTAGEGYFARRYFPAAYFAPRYFPIGVATPPPPVIALQYNAVLVHLGHYLNR